MYAGGEAILKFIGVEPARGYKPKAVVLKEKRLYPDIIAEPEGEGDIVFIEFQGYKDAMIRYSLAAKMTSFCAREAYSGPVLGAVIYTDKPFQQAALPLEMKSISGSFRLSGQFKEIVLSEYTQAE
jgi:hypothetical protein